MKNSAILDIFNGERGERESMPLPKSFSKKLADACDIFDELKEKLNKEQLELQIKYADTLGEYWSDEIDFYFVEGFKLGLRIGVECLEN